MVAYHDPMGVLAKAIARYLLLECSFMAVMLCSTFKYMSLYGTCKYYNSCTECHVEVWRSE